MKHMIPALMAVGLVAGSAHATVHILSAAADGMQEVPQVVTDGFGTFSITLDDVTGEISITGEVFDLTGTMVDAHLHGFAAPGANAGVLFHLAFPAGQTSGVVTGNAILTPTQVAGVLDGLSYINIHTTFRTSGEIRGQVLLVPAPAAASLLLGTLLISRRRR